RRADEIMTSPAATVTPEMSLEHAARQALRAGASTLPVVDDAGRLLGVVSGWDLLAALLDERRAGAGSTAR
ncbi:MAG: CBS domain-containing protein, partial [Jatrophihabitans sp.]|uniref:CBS domain-containing protein n=1 Tax=Jatrophihabitans sp. TaxID=1932789 RepID=UPI003F80740E